MLKHSKGQHREVLAFGRICSSGHFVQKSVRAFLKVLLGLFQTADVENLIELSHHTPDVRGRKTAVFHSVDDIASAGIVAPRLGQHSSQHRIIVHSVIPHFHKWRGAPRSFSCPVIRQPYSATALPLKGCGGLWPPRLLCGEKTSSHIPPEKEG